MNNKRLYILFANAILAASGIMLVLVSAFQYSNFWPIVIIVIDIFAVTWPTMCGGCSISDDDYYGSSYSDGHASFSWVLLGIFITVGYAIPIELYRTNSLTEMATYMTILGGTIILASILMYIRFESFEKDSNYAYTF